MIVNSKEMLEKAKDGRYAIAHFNINDLEWTKYILEEAEKMQTPIILGVSEGAKKYMGGFNTIYRMVSGLYKDLGITIDVCLHLDHGSSFEVCKDALDAGFTSVMIDGSKLSLEDNINVTNKVCEYAKMTNATVEAEVGKIGGTEDDITDTSMNANVADVIELVNKTSIDSIAPALGSVHGFYKGEPNLDFDRMSEIRDEINMPLVLHGGTGIDDHLIKKAISCGISKININTDLQVVWANAVREFLNNNKDAYDPRKVIGAGEAAIKAKVSEKIALFSNK